MTTTKSKATAVVVAVMPEGVEHLAEFFCHDGGETVVVAVMPEGVEHVTQLSLLAEVPAWSWP